ncbi:MAG: NAD(P)/FAD-dependent oxidoreductase [Allosphingosinicella sp.]|uniref:NAD(P)/FAD-dependent oxidoreductase n=1 Tax=Allosphingosinicella sp. TaxID=2823234 RepID=UPI0039221D20
MVVGAGFAGLAAALELSAAGRSVMLVDAGEPSSNASASSAGQVGPLFLGGGRAPADAIRALGRGRGEAFARMIAGSGRWLFDLIRHHSIECGARQGYVCAYRNAATLERAAERFEDWKRLGGRCEALAREDLAGHVGTSRYAGGFFLPEGGILNPVQLMEGLLGLLEARGVEVRWRAPIVAIEGEADRFTVRSATGRIEARAVIVATGLDRSSPMAALPRTAYGAACGVAATAPLGDRGSGLLPQGGPVADLDDKAVFAPAIDQEGRLVVSFLLEKEPPRLPASLIPAHRRLARTFPGADLPQFETLSWGRIGITPDGLPRLFRNAAGIVSVSGCNGFGLTMGMSAAREAARLVSGTPAAELSLPVREPRPLPGARIAPALMRSLAAPLANRLGV